MKIYVITGINSEENFYASTREHAERIQYIYNYTHSYDKAVIRAINVKEDIDKDSCTKMPKALFIIGVIDTDFAIEKEDDRYISYTLYSDKEKHQDSYDLSLNEIEFDDDKTDGLLSFVALISTIDGESVESLQERIEKFVLNGYYNYRSKKESEDDV